MGFGTVLTALVIVVGGGSAHKAGPPVIPEGPARGDISLTQVFGKPIAWSETGDLTVTLRPGVFKLEASLSTTCGSVLIHVNSHPRRGAHRTVRLYCKAS